MPVALACFGVGAAPVGRGSADGDGGWVLQADAVRAKRAVVKMRMARIARDLAPTLRFAPRGCGGALAFACVAFAPAAFAEPDGAAPSASPSATQAPAPEKGAPASTEKNAEPPARPPPLPDLPIAPPPWNRSLDVGGDFVVMERPATGERNGNPSPVRYAPATGFGIHVRWALFEHLHITAYYLDCHMPVLLPEGALGQTGTLSSPPVETFSFGIRVSPSMTWGRFAGWLTAGGGWGRMEFGRVRVETPQGATYLLRERSGTFAEIPLGLGLSYQIIPKWLSVDVELTGAFNIGQHGEAFDPAQTVDASGKKRVVDPMPALDGTFVQAIGLSVLL